jgi:E3 ubiquitin-protein ligase HUWE1
MSSIPGEETNTIVESVSLNDQIDEHLKTKLKDEHAVND